MLEILGNQAYIGVGILIVGVLICYSVKFIRRALYEKYRQSKSKQVNRHQTQTSEQVSLVITDSDETEAESDKAVGEALQEYIQLSFQTTGYDVKAYSKELLKRMMRIYAFKKLIHEHEINVIEDGVAEITFILKQSSERAMDDPVIKKILTE